jgi:hypothetical protein
MNALHGEIIHNQLGWGEQALNPRSEKPANVLGCMKIHAEPNGTSNDFI